MIRVLYHRHLFTLREQLGEFIIFDFYILLTFGCSPNPASFQATASTSPGTWRCKIAGRINSKKIDSSGPKRSIGFRNVSHESPSGEQVANTPPGNHFRASCSADLAFRTFQCADIRCRDREQTQQLWCPLDPSSSLRTSIHPDWWGGWLIA
jgi:hypothetical protein